MVSLSSRFLMFLILSIPIYSCSVADMKIYNWKPTESAFKKYPTIILGGNLLLEDGTSVYVPDNRIAQNGWGEIGSIHIVEPEIKPLPKNLYINWFSLVEDKFYEANIALPFEEMKARFEKGFIDPETREKFEVEFIVIGTSLEGNITVWLSGAGFVTELMTSKGQEAKDDWSQVTPNTRISRHVYVDKVLEDTLDSAHYDLFRHKKLPSDSWARYMERRNLNFNYRGISSASIWLEFLNGESIKVTLSSDINRRFSASIPKTSTMKGKFNNGKPFSAEVEYDERELHRLFVEFEKEYGDNLDYALNHSFNPLTRKIDVDIYTADKVVRLENVSSSVYF